MAQELMTLDEMAEYLRLPRTTAVNLLHVGRIVGQMIVKHWRIAKTAVDTFLTSPQAEIKSIGRKPKATTDSQPGA